MSTTVSPDERRSESADPRPLVIRLDDAVPVLQIPSDLDFDALRDWLRAHLPDQLDHVGGRASRLDVGDRDLQLFDLRRLVNLLRDDFSVEITGLYAHPVSVRRYAERELKLKLFVGDAPPPTPTTMVEDLPEDAATEAAEPDPGVPPSPLAFDEEDLHLDIDATVEVDVRTEIAEARVEPGRRTLTLRRTLRSGTAVRFDGDVVLFGDLNPGAQIVAAGNIIVLGALKGMAHAGATGDEDCFILAFDVRPTQLRIARRIALPPERDGERTGLEPEVARIRDDQIAIEPYRARISR